MANKKFALYEFVDTQEIEVGETDWIVEQPEDLVKALTGETIVRVTWTTKRGSKKKDGKHYAVRILQLSDDAALLRSLARDVVAGRVTVQEARSIGMEQRETGRGQRKKYPSAVHETSSDSENDEIPQKVAKASSKELKQYKKSSSREVLARIKERKMANCDSRDVLASENVDDGAALKAENAKLRRENEQLRHTLTALSYLPGLVHALKQSNMVPLPASTTTITSPVSSATQVPSTAAAAVPTTPRSTMMKPSFASPAAKAEVSATTYGPSENQTKLVAKASRANVQKFVNDLMSGIYEKDYMAAHTLGGKSSRESNKDALPKDDIENLIEVSLQAFPNETASSVRAAIRQKLNNAEKSHGRQLKAQATTDASAATSD